jgi:Mg-chelatase subunit ChlD
VPRVAGGWGGPVYDHFHGLGGVGSERAGMGGLARMLRFDVLLADRVAFAGGGSAPSPYVYTSEDVLWFDGAGNQTRIEQVCQAWGTGRSVAAGTAGSPFTVRPPDAPLVPLDNEYVPSRSLGDVEVLCGLTPEPSYTPPPTRTATRTATPSRTPAPTVTATSTPTQTPRPGRIYLPMAIWGPCNPEGWYSDVALVIDLSTSMARPTGRGRSKILATIEAAKWFVDHMAHLDPDPQGRHEQVAVAGFNSEGWIEQGLTNDRRSARAGLDRLPAKMREYTRLDLAVTVGAEATGSGHLPDNHRVVILLTDGLPNQVPLDPDGTMETTVLKAAAAARAQDVSIYTIAIGTPTDTNPVLLQAMSSGPGYYYYMPDPEDLEKVYDEIYGSIPCPRDGFGWPGSWP